MNKEAQILKEMPVRIPVNGTFELTVRCNLHCKMCLFRHDDSENAEIMAKELTTEQWIDMARQAAEAGTMSLLITGGEPMLRPDFCEIWEGIYKQGFIITLYTNATLVTPKIMETLRKYPPHKIGITIYGASAATYEKVCGNGDAFEKMIQGLKQLESLPSVIEVRTTLIKDNVEDIQDIENLASRIWRREVKVTHANNVIDAVRGGCAKVKDCRLSPEDTIHLLFQRTCNSIDRYLRDNHLEVQEIGLRVDKKVKNEAEVRDYKISLLGCDAGMKSYVITWDGKMLSCQLLGDFYTEALKSGLSKAWIELPVKIKVPEITECDYCELRDMCGTCCAVRRAETGSFNQCSAYHKEIAKVNKKYQEEVFQYGK